MDQLSGFAGESQPSSTLDAAPIFVYPHRQIVGAAFFGSPLAGGILLYLNRRRAGDGSPALALLAGIGITVALVVAGALLPDAAGHALPIAGLLAIWQLAKSDEQRRTRHHPSRRFVNQPWWRAGGVTALCMVGFVVLLGAGLMITGNDKVEFGHGEEVLFDDGATRVEAQKVGEFLRASGFFNDKGDKTVEVTHEGEARGVSFVIKAGYWDRPEVIEEFTKMKNGLSLALGSPVHVHLCDDYMKPQHTIP